MSYSDHSIVAGAKLLRRTDGSVLATFSTPSAAAHCWAALRAGDRPSTCWHTQGSTTSGDRVTFDALPVNP